jgi:cytochrome c peroxidase
VETLEEQVSFPIHASNELGSNWDQIISKLSKDTDYKKTFARLFPQGLTSDSIAHSTLEAWYARLGERKAYRQHVMQPMS